MIITNDNKSDNNHDNKNNNSKNKSDNNHDNKSENKNEKKNDNKNGNKSDNKNARRLKKSYEKLCTVTFQKTKQLDENADIKIIKDAFSAVKEGINIGLLLDRENEGENTLRVIFEGLTDETSV